MNYGDQNFFSILSIIQPAVEQGPRRINAARGQGSGVASQVNSISRMLSSNISQIDRIRRELDMLNRQIDSIRSLEQRLDNRSEQVRQPSTTESALEVHSNGNQVNVASQANGGFSPLRRLRPIVNVRQADQE